ASPSRCADAARDRARALCTQGAARRLRAARRSDRHPRRSAGAGFGVDGRLLGETPMISLRLPATATRVQRNTDPEVSGLVRGRTDARVEGLEGGLRVEIE